MTAPLPVVVTGAGGRMGRLVCEAVSAAPDLRLAGVVNRGDDPDRVLAAVGARVVVDFTEAGSSRAVARAAVERAVHPVIGTSGWAPEAVEDLARACAERRLGGLLAPNFSIGAVIQMESAERAAAHLRCTAIEETHHTGKRDSPSGTALATARRIAASSGRAAPITSARRDGLVAEQRVIFSGPGERLELLHRVDDRRAYLPGVLLAVRRVGDLVHLARDLRELLG